MDCKEIQPVHPKGDQSWVFIGGTDAEAETPIFWPPDSKSWFIGKDPDAGWDWGQEEKGTTEDYMVGWHHQLNSHEFEWTPGVGDGQGGCTLHPCDICFITRRLYLLIHFTCLVHPQSLPLATANLFSVSRPCSWPLPRKIPQISEITWCSFSVYFTEGPSVLSQMARFSSLFWLNSTSLCVYLCICVYVRFSLSTHLVMDI